MSQSIGKAHFRKALLQAQTNSLVWYRERYHSAQTLGALPPQSETTWSLEAKAIDSPRIHFPELRLLLGHTAVDLVFVAETVPEVVHPALRLARKRFAEACPKLLGR